jgi:hypothetical protein
MTPEGQLKKKSQRFDVSDPKLFFLNDFFL